MVADLLPLDRELKEREIEETRPTDVVADLLPLDRELKARSASFRPSLSMVADLLPLDRELKGWRKAMGREFLRRCRPTPAR